MAETAEYHAALQGACLCAFVFNRIDQRHVQIITIGDHSKAETRKYFRERILPDVPERLRPRLDFEKLYEAFGGKIAHWQDYIADYGESLVHVS